MVARSVRGGLVLCLSLLGALPLSLAAERAIAGDLTPAPPEPTTKGEPTTKDLSTGTAGTLTPTPSTPKTGGTGGGVAKPPVEKPSEPPASASASASASATESASTEPAPSSSAPVPKSGLGPFARRKIALGVGDLAVSLSMPESFAELPEASLPELEEQKDVTVVTRKGFGVHEPKGKPPVLDEVVVVCGKASGEFWADAIRDAAFTQMIAAIEKEAGRYSTIKSIEPEPIRSEGDRFLQSFAAEADYSVDGKTMPAPLGKGKQKSATTVKLQGLSFIGFHAEKEGKTPDIIACSVACAQLAADGDSPLCPATIGSIEISGSFSAVPKRSAVAELLFKLKKDPTTLWLAVVGGVFLVLVLVLVAVLVARRRKHAHDHDEHDEHDDYDAGYHAGVAAAQAAAEIKATMHASPPPPEGFFDPQTLTRKKT